MKSLIKIKLQQIAVISLVVGIVACATVNSEPSYVICNDYAANSNCPDNTANIVIGM